MKGTSDFVDYTINSESNVDSAYPASNLNVRDTATIEMRSLDLTETQIEFSLGSVITDPKVLLWFANFTDYRIEDNDASYNSGILNLAEDPDLIGIYKDEHVHTGFSDSLMRLIIPAQSTIDGATVFKLGVFALANNLEDFLAEATSTFELPMDSSISVAESVSQSETGRQDIQNLSDIPQKTFNLSGPFLNNSNNRQKLSKVFIHPQRKLIYFEMDVDGSRDWWLAQRQGTMENGRQTARHRRYSVSLKTIK